MSEHSKISLLLQTWMDYIRLSDLANAEVDAGNEELPCIWDKGVSLVGDQLLVNTELFQELKQQFKDFQQRGKKSE